MTDDHEAALNELRTTAAILTEALDAEKVPGPLAKRIFNRFLFGHPDGLHGGPLPHPALEAQRDKTTFGTGPGASSMRAQLAVEFPDLFATAPPSEGITNFHIDMPPLVPPVTGIAGAAELLLKPIGPVTFDANLFQWLIDEEARITALYGPRLKSVSGSAALVHWWMRQFPQADPGVTSVNLLGTVAVVVDDDVPFDSLRLTYVDGTHKDVRVIEAPDDWPGYQWPSAESMYLQPPDGLRAQLQREAMFPKDVT